MHKLRESTCTLILFFVVFAPPARAADFAWNHVGNGGAPATASLNGSVTALHAAGSDLYVGGTFTDAGGVASADHLAKWNGSAWSGFAPLNGSVFAIAFAGGKLFVGGAFNDAGANPDADFLAVWSGSAWEPFCAAVAAWMIRPRLKWTSPTRPSGVVTFSVAELKQTDMAWARSRKLKSPAAP